MYMVCTWNHFVEVDLHTEISYSVRQATVGVTFHELYVDFYKSDRKIPREVIKWAFLLSFIWLLFANLVQIAN